MSAGIQFHGAAVTFTEIADRAKVNAQAWKENCWVYEKPGYWICSRGPDLDHPKTAPTFIVEYVKEMKRERV